MLKCLFCTMQNYNEQISKNGSGRMKRPPLARNSKAEEVQFLRSSIPPVFLCTYSHPLLFWCRYPLVCGYFVALLSGIFIDIGPCNKHFSKSNHVLSYPANGIFPDFSHRLTYDYLEGELHCIKMWS